MTTAPLDRLASRHRGLSSWIRVGAAGGPGWLNGWAEHLGPEPNVGTLSEAPAVFCLDDWGMAHLTITMARRSNGTGGVLFYLPAGYRPAYRTVCTIWALTGDIGTEGEGGERLDIHPDGAVQARDNVKLVLLASVCFRAVKLAEPPLILPPEGGLYPSGSLYPSEGLYPRD